MITVMQLEIFVALLSSDTSFYYDYDSYITYLFLCIGNMPQQPLPMQK